MDLLGSNLLASYFPGSHSNVLMGMHREGAFTIEERLNVRHDAPGFGICVVCLHMFHSNWGAEREAESRDWAVVMEKGVLVAQSETSHQNTVGTLGIYY